MKILLLFILTLSTVSAQKAPPPSRLTFDLYGGMGGGTDGVTYIYGINSAWSSHAISFRGIYCMGNVNSFSRKDNIFEVALLYGFKPVTGSTISGGLGHVTGTITETKSDYIEMSDFAVYGFAVQASYIYPVFSFMGTSIAAHANFNSLNTFYAITASLHFGRF
ncbi:MAG TPA: hypothetical protein VEC36_10185 [Patescibacteria group bacterium]|nr:hypothetical protein [Patescibacteria group bacterium]